tara:strand:+ start:2484 stop:3254 length:771 start_codon:yes stop_codon:yes gene_type:complete
MSDKTIYDVRHPIDKKVIVVGNSPSILKKEYGEIIDSYDIVIRVNRCITQGYEKHIGKKIDIWATTRTDSIKSWVPENYKDIQYLWTRTKKPKPGSNFLKLPKDFPNYGGRYIMYKNQKWWSNVEPFLKPFNLKQELDTGLITILTACRFFNDVTVHGFTFGTQSDDETNISGYYRDLEVDEDGKHPEDKWWFSKFNLKWAKEKNKRRQILQTLIKEGIPMKNKEDKHGFPFEAKPVKILNRNEIFDYNPLLDKEK